MNNEFKICDGFDITVGQTKVKEVDIGMPREWQADCFEHLRGSNNSNIHAATGAGKSYAIKFLGLDRIKDTDEILVISAPTVAVGLGFWNNTIETFKYGWHGDLTLSKDNQLCYDTPNKSKRFRKCLERQTDDVCDRVVICCHATLTNFFETLDDKSLLDRVVLWIDESHHIMVTDKVQNKLGAVAKYFIENDLNINMTTATPFRGDKATIIPPEHLDRFNTYSLDYVRHFEENCAGLDYTYKFLLQDKCEKHALKSMFKDDIRKTLVYIPSPGHSAAHACGKHAHVKDVLWAITGRKREHVKDEVGVYNIKRRGETIRVLDLVETDDREERLLWFSENHETIDVVIGIKIIKEGFDWPAANRAMIIGQKNSLNEVVQIMGRCFRPYPIHKPEYKKVEIFHVFPWVDNNIWDSEGGRDQINNFLKTIAASLLMENLFNPVIVDIPTTVTGKKREKRTHVFDYLKEAMSETNINSMVGDSFDACVSHGEFNTYQTVGEYEDAYRSIIEEIIDEHGVIDHRHETVSWLLETFKRRSRNVQISLGEDAEDVDYDFVDPVGFVYGHVSKVCGASVLKDFHRVLRPQDTMRRCHELRAWVEANN